MQWRSALWATAKELAGYVCMRTQNTYLGAISDPCCIREPIVNHSELFKENLFSKTSGASELQGCGFSHSYGLNLNTKRANTLQELFNIIDSSSFVYTSCIMILLYLYIVCIYVVCDNECLWLLILLTRQQRCVQCNIKINMWRCSI